MLSPHKILFIVSSVVLACSLQANEIKAPKTQSIQCPIPSYDAIGGINAQRQKEHAKDLTILSQNTSIQKNNIATFSGGVTLLNNEQKVMADNVIIDQKKSAVTASGDIHFQNNSIDIFAKELTAQESKKETTLSQTSYQITNNPGHGDAEKITVNEGGSVILKNSSYTTCYGENPEWKINASEISIEAESQTVKAYNARFSVLDVPVFYLPYFSVPIGNERKTGFLYPKISSSNDSGLEVQTPYYLNISENMDATFTPRYMSKRGTQLLSEYRYLYDNQYGEVHFEYLNKDDELQNNTDERYLARFEHMGTFSERYRAYIDYTTLSDDNYLVDLGSDEYSANDAYLYQIGELAYFADTWQATIQLQDFEVLGNHTPSYKTLPHIELSSQQPLPFMNASFDIYSELSLFESPDSDQADAQRYHVEAGFNLPISTPAWFINSEIKILQTYYEQDNIPESSSLSSSVDRTLSKYRIHGGINFERALSNEGFTQTLEPQLQYLYIPDKDQSDIGLYDTTTLQDDYNGLFRDTRYSGLDRIAQANQYTWGITSRILDPKNIERFRFSIGRIVYLNDSNITVDEDDEIVDKSALASEVYWQLHRKWQFSSNMQYNTDTNTTNKSQMNIAYEFSKNQSIQLNHRYTRDVSGIRLEQASMLTNVNINTNWQMVGRYTKDLQLNRSIEAYTGLQYSSCCWGVRFIYHRHINSNLDELNTSNEDREAFDSGFKLEFVYNGLSGGSNSKSTQDMFNSSIFGYKRPYFLKN